MILDSVWKHQRTIHSCYGIKSCDFGPNRGLGIFITDMSISEAQHNEKLNFDTVIIIF